jgi:hypothetical protein
VMAPDLNSISRSQIASTMPVSQPSATEELTPSRRVSSQMPPPPPRSDSLLNSPQMDNSGVGLGPGRSHKSQLMLQMLISYLKDLSATRDPSVLLTCTSN